jgi:hypothetical protein
MVAALLLLSGLAAAQKASMVQDSQGNLHVNSTAGQRVFLNGMDVAATLSSLSASVSALVRDAGWREVVVYPRTDVCSGAWAYVAGKGCHKASTSGGCATKTFSTGGLAFSEVRGRLVAYQQGSTDGFLDNDSISIWTTSGTHLWTYAFGYTSLNSTACSCASLGCPARCPSNGGFLPDAHVGSSYYCESGASACSSYGATTFFPTKLFASRPAFVARLAAIQADLEVRVCLNQGTSDEDLFFDVLELHVR